MRHQVMWFARLADLILFILLRHHVSLKPFRAENVFKNILVQKYDQSMAKYHNTYHCYGLAIKAGYMSPKKDYL